MRRIWARRTSTHRPHARLRDSDSGHVEGRGISRFIGKRFALSCSGGWSLHPRAWCRVPGVRCSVLGVRCLVPPIPNPQSEIRNVMTSHSALRIPKSASTISHQPSTIPTVTTRSRRCASVRMSGSPRRSRISARDGAPARGPSRSHRDIPSAPRCARSPIPSARTHSAEAPG